MDVSMLFLLSDLSSEAEVEQVLNVSKADDESLESKCIFNNKIPM